MKPESKHKLKIGLAAVFLLVLVDVTLFFLAENSIISFDTNLIVAYTWNITVLIAVLYLVNRGHKRKTDEQLAPASGSRSSLGECQSAEAYVTSWSLQKQSECKCCGVGPQIILPICKPISNGGTFAKRTIAIDFLREASDSRILVPAWVSMKNTGLNEYELHIKCADVNQSDFNSLVEKYKLSKRQEKDILVIW